MFRIILTIVASLVAVSLVFTVPINAKPPLHAKKTSQPPCARSTKPAKVITAHMTFHDARPRMNTCNGKRQNGYMAAINRNKHHPLMGSRIVPIAYRDKKTGKKVYFTLPARTIADVMGPGPRRKSNYHIDYYLSGPMPASYDKYNKTTWYFQVVD